MNELRYQDVLDILRLLDTAGFADLEIEYEGTRVRATKRIGEPVAVVGSHGTGAGSGAGTGTGQAHALSPREHEPSVPRREDESKAARPAPVAPVASVAELGPGQEAVKPPMQGVFYASPAPGQPPFATIGQRVREGDQLGIVEVMKLFTPVTSPCDGTILEILVSNEQVVDRDQVLMIVGTERGTAS